MEIDSIELERKDDNDDASRRENPNKFNSDVCFSRTKRDSSVKVGQLFLCVYFARNEAVLRGTNGRSLLPVL